MIGEKLGHYRLTAKIGEGGMGVVYRARDEELNRDVAVKVLAAGRLDQLDKNHLLREAQTASALNHPNICTIYEIGRVDDGFYLVMELVEGQPLDEMARSTRLTTEAAAGLCANTIRPGQASSVDDGDDRTNRAQVTTIRLHRVIRKARPAPRRKRVLERRKSRWTPTPRASLLTSWRAASPPR
jgi:serine/threonine protein kinase